MTEKTSRKIWIIGGANIDILGTAEGALLEGDSNPGEIEFRFGGVGRNIAQAVARFGGSPYFVTCFGKDSYGRVMKEDCRKLGMDVSYSAVSKKHNASIYLALMDQNRDMSIAMSDMKIMSEVNPELIKNVIPEISEEDILIIDANLSEEALEYIFSNTVCRIAADPVSIAKISKLKKHIPKISIFKPNKIEAEYISGIEIRDEESGKKALDWFLSRGVKEIIITVGENGALIGIAPDTDEGGEPHFLHLTHRILNLENATGGGDAFLGAYILRRSKGESPVKALAFAATAAALTIESPDEERKRITQHSIEERIESMNIKEKEL